MSTLSKIVIWGLPNCNLCKTAFNFFREKGYEVSTKNIEQDLIKELPEIRSEIMSAYAFEGVLPVVQITGNAYTFKEAKEKVGAND